MGRVGVPVMLTIRLLTSREGSDSSNATGRSTYRALGRLETSRMAVHRAKRTVIDARTLPDSGPTCAISAEPRCRK
jgi:hypothetical protein